MAMGMDRVLGLVMWVCFRVTTHERHERETSSNLVEFSTIVVNIRLPPRGSIQQYTSDLS